MEDQWWGKRSSKKIRTLGDYLSEDRFGADTFGAHACFERMRSPRPPMKVTIPEAYRIPVPLDEQDEPAEDFDPMVHFEWNDEE